jgi:hypothetical protein
MASCIVLTTYFDRLLPFGAQLAWSVQVEHIRQAMTRARRSSYGFVRDNVEAKLRGESGPSAIQ